MNPSTTLPLNDLLLDLARTREQVLDVIFRPLGKTGELERRCSGGSGYPRDWVDQALAYVDGFLEDPQYTRERDAVLMANSLCELVVEALVFTDAHKAISRGVILAAPMETADAEQEATLVLRAAALYMPEGLEPNPLGWVMRKAEWNLRRWAHSVSRPVHIPQKVGRSADKWLDLTDNTAGEMRGYVPDVADWMDVFLVFGSLVEYGRRKENG